MKKYIFLAASALTLASCSSDDFLGDTHGSTPTSANSAINFGGDAGKITRATSNVGTPQQMLDGQFLVYGVKKTNDQIFHNVFVNYSVWDVKDKTTSNTKGWEYVGEKDATNLGTGQISLGKAQTIKYWDYSASVYHFVAGSPIKAFSYKTHMNPTTGTDIESATVTGLAGHYEANNTETALETNPVYIAAPVKIEKKDGYQKPVTFTFQRQQSMVRVGLYETIPGYSITKIKFYNADGTTATSSNIILTSATQDYFVGGSNVSGTVTYNWDTPSYTFKYTNNDNLKKSKNWYAGELGTLATKSSEPKVNILYGTDKDMSTTGYFTVLPTPSTTEASPILIKCNYTLTSDDDSGETIEVTGATAAIPVAYSKWEANTRYTYLFKISDKTNGYTGDDETKTGLYPITFDAVVKDEKQGTITTVATPSITTYQESSVDENSGIKYVKDKEIKVTVTDNTNGDIKTLSTNGTSEGSVAVYKLTKERTEADLQIINIKTLELAPTNSKKVTLATDNKSFTFTPDAEGYYAIQYLTTAATATTPAAYTYKVVKVVTPATTTE